MSEADAITQAPRAREDVRRVWWVRAAIVASIVLSGTALVGAVITRLEELSAPVPAVLGLRLGATPDEVRTSRGGGDWTSRVEPSGDLSLSRGEEHYEFHEGQLVAVSIVVAPGEPDATGSAFVLTPLTVLVREPAGEFVRVRMISRTCPTHAEEADRLAASVPR